MFALCPTQRTGTIFPQRGTATPLPVQLAIGLEIIQAVPITMEPDTPSILAHAEGSITTTAMAIKHMSQRGTYGKE
jgi:hypothetical protein